MNTTMIKEIKEAYGMKTLVLENGKQVDTSAKADYKVGDVVRVIPFMGAVKIEKVEAV